MFGVSRQAYYKAEKKSRIENNNDKSLLLGLVKQIRKKLPRVGTRKIYHMIKEQLNQNEIKIGRDKLFAILREEEMLVKRRRVYVRTTDSRHSFRRYPNLLKQISVSRPEEVWVSDLTYIRLEKGFCFLSMITDAYSRKIVGYDLSDSLAMDGAIRALKMAIGAREYKTQLIHHSDRGYQYCSKQYTGILVQNGIQISMTENSDPYENALAERMNRTIKEEFIVIKKITSIAVAKQLVDEAVNLYNKYRPHLSCEFMTPFVKHKFYQSNKHNINLLTNYI